MDVKGNRVPLYSICLRLSGGCEQETGRFMESPPFSEMHILFNFEMKMLSFRLLF
jgi:hypothetical protein